MTYYVYGIVDPTELPEKTETLADQLSAVIYVGKGIGSRSEAHAAEARKILEDEAESERANDSEYGAKLDRLVALYRQGHEPRTVKLSAGFEIEADAYAVEAFAIEAINALRIAQGKPPLTNRIKGHGIAIEPLPQYISRLSVEKTQVTDRSGDGELAILVACDTDPIGDGRYVPDSNGELPARIAGYGPGRVIAMKWVGEAPERRGWDVHMPWDDEEARRRGQRYWPIGIDQMSTWLAHPETAPRYLLLGVKEDKRRIIRYAWRINPEGAWEYYGFDSKRSHIWGVPITEPVNDHPLVNTVPMIGPTQAMLGNASGVKLIRY
ncbi:MAG: GIY-YIG nuclease family protein [Gordonia sp. (in: high G+C Gram-positive bacteria)]|uniref:GIY-YIG nuclease family protein n=1 Tax=Gordonia sp. (in: high G+C Gram-positive bacteria) TaxID=84139 RepID=UPI0039E4BD16